MPNKLNSLILLIKSLSKSEKKALRVYASQTSDKKIYLSLFDIIDKEKYTNNDTIADTFNKKYPDSSIIQTVKYLFDIILQIAVNLNLNKNKVYDLYNTYLKSKVLKERGLFEDYTDMLQESKEKAKSIGEFNLLLTLQKDELVSDLFGYFDYTNDDELFDKQQDIYNNLKTISQINEQSFLYQMLRFKIEQQKTVSSNNIYAYNDLLISEMSLVSNLKNDIFEIRRLHQLFQANYFANIGHYKSALNSYAELNQLYLDNEKYWNNPPVYYLMVLKGVLESLNQMRLFDEMPKYQNQLLYLADKYPYVHFVMEINVINFIYTVSPLLYKREYKKCIQVINQYQESIIDKLQLLPPRLFLSMSVSLSSIYLMNKDLSRARRILAPIINSETLASLKIFRSVQLLNLIIYYELEDTDYIETAIRSIKRKNRKQGKSTSVEKLIFKYLETDWKVFSKEKSLIYKKKIKDEIENMVYEVNDIQLIKIFNFIDWILIKVK